MEVSISIKLTAPALAEEGSSDVPASTNLDLSLKSGEAVIVTGPNGAGKSSLLSEIAGNLRAGNAQVETFFGHRHIQFASADVDQVGMSLVQLRQNLPHNATRFYNPWGEQHLRSVVRRLIDVQAQRAHAVIEAQRRGVEFGRAIADNPPVLESLNSIFAAARLPIKIIFSDGTLRVTRGDFNYGIDRMSDGERAALLLVGAVLVQSPDSFIIIDEPERHLNPAISGLLLSALTRFRSDIGFVFATHNLELIEWINPDKVIHLRNSCVIQSNPEIRSFDLALLSSQEDIPEEIKFAILGTRQKLLLVEGTSTSEDRALYGYVYPGWNVVARGGWETVTDGVRALSGNQDYHWLHAVGIIDLDGRSKIEQEKLMADRIFCLPVPTIENLFFHETVVERMAFEIHKLKGGMNGIDRINLVETEILRLLPEFKDEIITRRLVWEGNRKLSEQKISVKSVRSGQIKIREIDLSTIRIRVEKEFDEIIYEEKVWEILGKLPIKNSGIPAKVAVSVGFDNFKDYTRAVLHQIENNSEAGRTILESLRDLMPILT
ncbi:MAG: AAA family ATPase [Rhodospirillales bacterium]|nr:AAA family ATPase [Rhodospirillales bacterium]